MYSYIDENEEWNREHFDIDTLAEIEERLPYALIHALLADIRRLEYIVMETREEVNSLSPGGIVYDMTAENLSDGTHYCHPSLERYFKYYEDEAIIPWES